MLNWLLLQTTQNWEGSLKSKLDNVGLQEEDFQRLLDWSGVAGGIQCRKMQGYAYWRLEQELSVSHGSEGIAGGPGRKVPWGVTNSSVLQYVC